MLAHGTYPVLHAWSDGDQGGAGGGAEGGVEGGAGGGDQSGAGGVSRGGTEGGAGQGDGPVVQRIPLVPAGELTPDVVVGYPQLRGYCALTADISRHQAARMLRGRLVVELGADPEAVGGTGRLRRQDVVPQAGRAGSGAERSTATSQTSQTAGPDAGPTAERSAATSQVTPAPASSGASAALGAAPAVASEIGRAHV